MSREECQILSRRPIWSLLLDRALQDVIADKEITGQGSTACVAGGEFFRYLRIPEYRSLTLSAKSIGLLTAAFRSLEDSGSVQLCPLLPRLPSFVPSISHTSFSLSPDLDYHMVSYPSATVLETQNYRPYSGPCVCLELCDGWHLGRSWLWRGLETH